jgi:hypothetical protein
MEEFHKLIGEIYSLMVPNSNFTKLPSTLKQLQTVEQTLHNIIEVRDQLTQNKHSFEYFHLTGTDERDQLTRSVFNFEREIEKVKKIERMHAMIRAEKEDRELKRLK